MAVDETEVDEQGIIHKSCPIEFNSAQEQDLDKSQFEQTLNLFADNSKSWHLYTYLLNVAQQPNL